MTLQLKNVGMKRMGLQLNYTRTKEHKKFVKEYLEVLKMWRDMLKWDTKTEKIEKHRKEAIRILTDMYNAYKNKKMQEAKVQMDNIAALYKNSKVSYEDPQKELLRRQDFDMSIALMQKLEVIEMLEDYQKDLTQYELMKIKTLYPDSLDIAMLLEERRIKKDERYMEDPNYLVALNEFQVLNAINGMGLQMVYFPNEEDPKGYVVKNFELILSSRHFFTGHIENEMREVEQLLNAVPTLSDYEFNAFTEKQKTKYLISEIFDDSIFPTSQNYDPKKRFEYLKKLFVNEKDIYDPKEKHYNAYDHYKYLEHKHDMKLTTDAFYSRLYREKQAEMLSKQAEKEQVKRTKGDIKNLTEDNTKE